MFLRLVSFTVFILQAFPATPEPFTAQNALIAFPGTECRRDTRCAQPPEAHYRYDYQFEPEYITLTNTHTASTTHQIVSETFIAVVDVKSSEPMGLCETYIPLKASGKPTVTVYVDSTTTSHYFSYTTVTKELTFTHTATPTEGCIQVMGAVGTAEGLAVAAEKAPKAHDLSDIYRGMEAVGEA